MDIRYVATDRHSTQLTSVGLGNAHPNYTILHYANPHVLHWLDRDAILFYLMWCGSLSIYCTFVARKQNLCALSCKAKNGASVESSAFLGLQMSTKKTKELSVWNNSHSKVSAHFQSLHWSTVNDTPEQRSPPSTDFSASCTILRYILCM